MKSWKLFVIALPILGALSLISCKKDETPVPVYTSPRIIFKFRFDSTQTRLDNLGQPSEVPPGHAAQSPKFQGISAHYLELTPSQMTALGGGTILYEGAQTNAGGATAIDFDECKIVAEGEEFISYKLSDMVPGTYHYVRVSLAYQNYDIAFRASGLNWNARVASFVGFNNYITDYLLKTQTVTVNDDKLQGYWGVEANILGAPYVVTGQAPPGATTVPNPLFATSPVPAGSCVVTGQFLTPLVITGTETEDMVITLSLSTNKSFEWVEVNADGLYEPNAGENVVDMGLRGLIPIVE